MKDVSLKKGTKKGTFVQHRRGTGHLRRWKALFLLNAVSKSYKPKILC